MSLVEIVLGCRRPLAILATVLTLFLSFLSVVATVIAAIFTVRLVLRTRRRFRIGLITVVVGGLLLSSGASSGMTQMNYWPALGPKPVWVFGDPTYCDSGKSPSDQIREARWVVERHGIWYLKADTGYTGMDCRLR